MSQTSLRLPFHLLFPYGMTFDKYDVASLHGQASSLQRDSQSMEEVLAVPPAFADHYADAIYRPGLVIRTLVHQEDDVVRQQNLNGHLSLQTTRPLHFRRTVELAQSSEYMPFPLNTCSFTNSLLVVMTFLSSLCVSIESQVTTLHYAHRRSLPM
jgi:hypothetical protein